ncbi:unnamed protein product [Orchesella dallaii]|uniref:Major facilitator superfamily (MFS) profile domain-containing protein n=1 Tax=Orchesella dallaii TaxID=48710 RepID=A0ABP1Q2A6_9HEXA
MSVSHPYTIPKVEDSVLPENTKKVRFDWLISNRLGEFGAYQRKTYLLLGLPAIVCALHALSWPFVGAKVNYRCQLYGENESNTSYYDLPSGRSFNDSFPWEKGNNGKGRWSQCEKYNDTEVFISDSTNETTFSIVSCDEYVYDNSQYKTSARIDFQLVCGNGVWYTVAETLFKSGILVGAIVFGSLSDRLGRRPVFFYALCQQVTFGIIAAVAPNYTIFVIARFLIGMANSGVFLVAFVIAMELVGKDKRMVAGMGMQYFFTIGYVVIGVLAYFLREWRQLQLALSLPGILFLSYYWFMPESIRWLLANGKKEEAVKILKKAAITNKTIISETEFSQLSEEEKLKGSSLRILDISRYPRTVLRSLNIFLSWFVNSGVYYGLALNSANLGGNDYVNFILSGAVEVPAYALLLLTLNRFGRKRVLCSCMMLAGTFLVACGFIPSELTWLLVTLNMIGKMFNAAAYAAIYMFAAELFPTVIRNGGMGVSSVMARVGGILSDYVILLQEVWKPLPHLIFGGVSLTSGMLALLLPETLGKRLPETMEDSEKFGTSAYDNANTINGNENYIATAKAEKETRL